MRALTKILAGGVAAAALISAAPAAAQYYPGYGYGSGSGSGVIGAIINGVLGGGGYNNYGGYGGYGGGYGGYGGYGVNSQAVVSQCASAVQARLSGGYGYNGGYGGYGYNGGYGGNGYGGGRVLGVSRVEPRSSGGLTVRGVASSGASGGYAYGYNGQGQADLTWRCKTDYRGRITDISLNRAQSNYGYNNGYSPYNNDYSQYGYRRY